MDLGGFPWSNAVARPEVLEEGAFSIFTQLAFTQWNHPPTRWELVVGGHSLPLTASIETFPKYGNVVESVKSFFSLFLYVMNDDTKMTQVQFSSQVRVCPPKNNSIFLRKSKSGSFWWRG